MSTNGILLDVVLDGVHLADGTWGPHNWVGNGVCLVGYVSCLLLLEAFQKDGRESWLRNGQKEVWDVLKTGVPCGAD